ncbi:phosphonate C-P lyase system protein PhnG [Crenobacter cavernae]|uniref:Phosphonate C-P lyase system protein PhnG n=1 Tax=Crenobacter cavernae TaxID=2290923 RepID=A0ABY0FGZ1_9NEIS|nr:phosphonate C-P lyase system protein PhnG [Crenobacter cavernae]RXZ45669.1 phosphonate C-P lyase system protein PhnG [Crenobacter cavernae]
MSASDLPSRQRWMRALSHAPLASLAARFEPHLPDSKDTRWLRRAETGLVMVRGRVGGTGAQFNLGEVSVTRASVALGQHVGHAWVKGGSARHAELAALADALLQSPAHHKDLMTGVVDPLEAEIAARRDAESREAAASKVEFFTMVRGE